VLARAAIGDRGVVVAAAAAAAAVVAALAAAVAGVQSGFLPLTRPTSANIWSCQRHHRRSQMVYEVIGGSTGVREYGREGERKEEEESEKEKKRRKEARQ
jgi:hypothetical protein